MRRLSSEPVRVDPRGGDTALVPVVSLELEKARLAVALA